MSSLNDTCCALARRVHVGGRYVNGPLRMDIWTCIRCLEVEIGSRSRVRLVDCCCLLMVGRWWRLCSPENFLAPPPRYCDFAPENPLLIVSLRTERWENRSVVFSTSASTVTWPALGSLLYFLPKVNFPPRPVRCCYIAPVVPSSRRRFGYILRRRGVPKHSLCFAFVSIIHINISCVSERDNDQWNGLANPHPEGCRKV